MIKLIKTNKITLHKPKCIWNMLELEKKQKFEKCEKEIIYFKIKNNKLKSCILDVGKKRNLCFIQKNTY